MGQSSNYEPRRFYRARTPGAQHRPRCASCGARAHVQSVALPFCDACLECARQDQLVEWDDLGDGD
jgi:hypothetical protein